MTSTRRLASGDGPRPIGNSNEAATIYIWGLLNLLDNLDKETGLPYCGFGCVGDDKIEGRVDGHDDRIMRSIKANGLPKNSFKPWEKEVFGLKDDSESRREHEKAERLVADGPALKSQDGTYTIKPVVKQTTIDGKVVKRLAIELSGDGRKPRKEVLLLAHADDKVELFSGPKGSGFAVVATEGSRYDTFMALDLRQRRRLRMEFVSRPEQPGTHP